MLQCFWITIQTTSEVISFFEFPVIRAGIFFLTCWLLTRSFQLLLVSINTKIFRFQLRRPVISYLMHLICLSPLSDLRSVSTSSQSSLLGLSHFHQAFSFSYEKKKIHNPESIQGQVFRASKWLLLTMLLSKMRIHKGKTSSQVAKQKWPNSHCPKRSHTILSWEVKMDIFYLPLGFLTHSCASPDTKPAMTSYEVMTYENKLS